MPQISIPHDFEPRWYQVPLWRYMQKGGMQKKRACCVWHRRGGKDLNSIHLCATAMMERPALYWHLFPTYAQGKKIAWDGKTKAGRPFLDAFPEQLRKGINNTEMKLTLKTGAQYQVIGADKPDSLVGANPVGIIISEWSLMPPSVWNLLLPILAENDGWVIFIFTPRGKNHGWKTLKGAMQDDHTKGGAWFWEVLPNSYTKAITPEAIAQMIKDGMTPEMVEQEIEVSFDAPIQGSYYGKIITNLEKLGQVGEVPYDPRLPVHTAWDLGISDYTDIWFFQEYGQEVRIIDFYENCGEGLAHYIKVLQNRGYVYGKHYAPHDIEVRELGTGVSRYETARKLGIRFDVGRNLPVDEGIEAVRTILPRCWFDKAKTEEGREALKQYHKEFDDDKNCFRDKPEHDWSSHPADAFRELAQAFKRKKNLKKPQDKATHDYDSFAHI